MKSFLTVLAVTLFFTSTRSISSDNATVLLPASINTNHTRYAILDNDWGSTAFIPFLLALAAGIEVLGLASDTANTWVEQATLHGVSLPDTLASVSKKDQVSQRGFSSPSSREETCPVFQSQKARLIP